MRALTSRPPAPAASAGGPAASVDPASAASPAGPVDPASAASPAGRAAPPAARARRGSAARALRLVAGGLLETLWPTRCVGCDAPGTLLCDDCAAALPAIDQARACPRCGAPFGSLVCTECTRCRERDRDGDAPGRPGPTAAAPDEPAEPFDRLDGLRCYGVHAWPLDRLVRAYKDGGERRCADLLAGALCQVVRASYLVPGAPGEPLDAVCFVPCTPAAFARRGFDHMEAVAAGVARGLGLPLLDVLARRPARDQRGLSRGQRADNARGATACLGRLDGARVLLLDDVVTTGATMGASAEALRAAGARRVCGAAVARAW